MSLTSQLYKAARMSATARAARRGRLPQRYMNKLIGRQAAKVLRRLYR